MIRVTGKVGTHPSQVVYLWGNHAPVVGERRRMKEAWHSLHSWTQPEPGGKWIWVIIDDVDGHLVRMSKR